MTDTLNYAQLVEHVGRALHGREWVRALAADLGAVPRTVERVAQAAREGRDYPAAKAWLADLDQLVIAHMSVLQDMRGELAAAIERRAAEKAARRP